MAMANTRTDLLPRLEAIAKDYAPIEVFGETMELAFLTAQRMGLDPEAAAECMANAIRGLQSALRKRMS